MFAAMQNAELSERWKKISSFEFPFSAALDNEMGWEPEFRQAAENEYRKFAFLSSLFPETMVPSVHVDTVWHMHLLYTKSYQNFCQEALGVQFLHHEPATGAESEDQMYKSLYVNTLTVYEEFFAKPPLAIWGGDASAFRQRVEAAKI